ncbi:hypothetical protein D187_004585 [Cystobacter fuscus DSM 2262]|uniref:histidine kinase n=1 Tax=Cystobacter fuscus (strain ATCC 25194 / DSM 2262 / NBRC 100088 / M29) TaxID=1242864 RepID=S9PNB0_CYSF2|nr:hypothetical protein D187_004585 [Cystobacter fuscus DSM 2262]
MPSVPTSSSAPLPPAPLLLVDDYPPNLIALEAVLAPLGQPLVKVTSGEEALKAMLSEDFAAVLLDVQMPGLSGLETATLIKQRKRSAATPILFLSAVSRDEGAILEGYAHGAVDYIVKPYDPDILRAKVGVFVDLYRRGRQLQREEAEMRRRERELLERESAARVQAAVQEVQRAVGPLPLVDALLAAAPVGMTLVDRELRYVRCNAWIAHAIGRSPEQVVGRTVREVSPLEESARIQQRVEHVLRTGETLMGLPTYVDFAHTGERRHVMVNYFPVRGEDGAVVAVGALFLDVTAQVRAQQHAESLNERLIAQQHWLEAVLHRIPVPLVLVERGSGRFTFANAAADQMWGGTYPRPETRAEYDRIVTVRHLDGTPIPSEQMASARTARGESVSGLQMLLDTPRGSTAILVESSQVPAMEGSPAVGVVTFQDISALKEAERALQKREQEFRTLAESMPQVVWTARADGQLDYVNQVLTRYIGREEAAALGNSWTQLIHPEDLDETQRRWTHSVHTGEPYEVEYRIRRADGAYRWFLTRATCMREPDGRPLKWFGTATDIDDARRTRDAHRFLAEASALLGSTLEAEATLQQVARLAVPTLADWCCVDMLEEDGSLRRLAVSHTDPAKVRLAWEIARRYALNLKARYGVPHVLRTGETSWVPDVSEDMLVAATEGDPERLGMARQLGLRSFLAVPLVARGKLLGVLILAHSESGRRYDEADVRLAEDLGRRAGLAVDNARLYAASQAAVQLRDDFLGVASHELKTPLTPIQLKVQALQRRVSAEPEGVLPARQVGAVLDVVSTQTRKLSVLVSGLLDVSRISTGRLELHLEPVDLSALVREVAHAFEAEAAKADCALRLRLAEAPVVGRWDRLRLEQVVTNLLTNALKYGAGRPVEVTLATVDGRALLGVRDEGIGIAAEAQARIFEKFERAVSDRHYGGLGLGLYITREIVRALGGGVSVESEPERGALFTVSLPLRS